MKKPDLAHNKQFLVRTINHVKTGARARAYREHHDVKQDELGVVLGCSAAYVSQLESGAKKWGKNSKEASELLEKYCQAVEGIGLGESAISPREIMLTHQYLYYVLTPVWSDSKYDKFCSENKLDKIPFGCDKDGNYPESVKILANQILAKHKNKPKIQ